MMITVIDTWLPLIERAGRTCYKSEGKITAVTGLTVFSPWLEAIRWAYAAYLAARDGDAPPEDARFLLPNACKTEIVTTFNIRQWRHVFRDRALNPRAQWEIRGIMRGILDAFAERMPALFDDLLEAE